jgi:hypothetical protein
LKILLILLRDCFGLFALILALLFGATFTKGQRQKYPILRKLDGKQTHLLILVIFSGMVFYFSNSAKEIFEASSRPVIYITEGAVATFSGIERP